jgi:hypothetical protein
MIKEYLIQGKGYFNYNTSHYLLSNKEVSDIRSGYGYIQFKGTDKQLDSFLESLYEDESTFKVIGIKNKSI